MNETQLEREIIWLKVEIQKLITKGYKKNIKQITEYKNQIKQKEYTLLFNKKR